MFMKKHAIDFLPVISIFTALFLIFLSSDFISSQGTFPKLIGGRVFDNETLYCRVGVEVNVTGNVSGFIMNTVSYQVDEYGQQVGCGVQYANNESDNITFGDELITATAVNSANTGYVGSASGVPINPDQISIDLYLTDMANPRYYGIYVYPDASTHRRGSIIRVDSYWMDNSGVVSVAVEHNASGSWVNDSVVSEENVSSTKSVYDIGKKISSAYINTTNYSRGTTVFWRLLGWDETGNLNDSFSFRSFTVENALPSFHSFNLTPSVAYVNSTLNCSAQVSDLDGDGITLYFNWFIVGGLNFTEIRQGPLNESLLGPENLSGDETVYCRVTPYDGLENGTTSQAGVFINAFDEVTLPVDLYVGWNMIAIPLDLA